MDLISEYLKDLVFTRIETKEGYVIYGARISSMLGAGKGRYILAFVPLDFATVRQARLSNLRWQNLQCRTLQYGYPLQKQEWTLPTHLPDPIMYVKKRQKEYSRYLLPGYPFEILLLHDSRKKTVYQYWDKVSLSSALEEYNSLFNYVGDPSIFAPPKPDWETNLITSSFPSPIPPPPGMTSSSSSQINSPLDDSFELIPHE